MSPLHFWRIRWGHKVAWFSPLHAEPVRIRVHDVIIRGNAKTREELIEAEVADLLRSATTVQDLLSAAADASGS